MEKSLLSLLSAMPINKYTVKVLLLEKKGAFLKHIPAWVEVEEVNWFEEIKPIIMQPPQQTVADYWSGKKFFKIPTFVGKYYLSKKLNDRYIYYKEVFKSIPNNSNEYDVAIAYQGPTDVIDYYIANKVIAKKKIAWIHFDVENHLINQKLYKKLHEKYNKVFVVSEEARQHLVNLIPNDKNKTEVLFNIISPDLVEKMSQEKVVDFDEKHNGINIVTVGRLSLEKGQDIAIKVLSKLKENGYNVNWYCIGDGKARKEYENLITRYNLEDSFILLGAKENPYPYVKNADIYVQPSRHEGFCLTLAEAKCLCKPLISTNFTGAKEQIKDGYNGLIVKKNIDELLGKIKFLIENPKKRENLSSNLWKQKVDTSSEVAKLLNYIDDERSHGYESEDKYNSSSVQSGTIHS
ncbi:glycosyltransferase [Aquibacillus saliphilus]|uniref:glycosyltransferase n=1 Tax=Aquibacillus saliphilus TaxID=1909422 RepID=UPI001CEFBAF4